ncbi:centromere-associated protein E-like [Hylaeus anthracinus]|uniref:centromere-associated protein E-like n=1 Tax=Hylaeus anthracinus TaxID=313031 RepID=UPI0023B8BE29|nr:centromere-associated protein E-like [Hylaeus anthracinus]XP_054006612.1 centromere-associated protein E-like [Hylaeus anthracinus]
MGATGERFKEGRHINMSLSTLELVIMQLSESQDSQKHVNFRDSKLIGLLQTSLGGNAMTDILCAVTPAALEETQCTLSFACRAKSVKNKPEINEVMSDAALLKLYAKQLSKLQAELQRIKTGNRVAEGKAMESKLQEKEGVNQLLGERIELLKMRIVSGDTTNQESFKYKSKRRQTWGGSGLFNQHLPSFKPATELSSIKKVSYEKPHNRKSIIKSADKINQTFQTAFADFELELFESGRVRESRGDVTDSDDESIVTKRNYRVTFMDDVLIARSKDSITPEKINLNITPEKCDKATQMISYEMSPTTQKHILRQCIEDLTKEYVELCQFTVMEK